MDMLRKELVELDIANKNKKLIILQLIVIVVLLICINVLMSIGLFRLSDAVHELSGKINTLTTIENTSTETIKDTSTETATYMNVEQEVATEDVEKDILTVAGETYDIDPKLLESIERLESGHYTSELYLSKNNTWGAWDGYNWMSFDSREDSTMALAKCLRENYYDKGIVELEDIGMIYCPDKETTTDVNEAEEWATLVRAIYNEL